MAKASKKQTVAKITYTGDRDSIEYSGYTFPRGESVEVTDESVAKFLAANDFSRQREFSTDDPASSVAPEDALAAERAAHQGEIDKLNAEHADALKAQADALRAGWQEQHDALVAENESLKAQLSGAGAPTSQG